VHARAHTRICVRGCSQVVTLGTTRNPLPDIKEQLNGIPKNNQLEHIIVNTFILEHYT